MVAFHIKNSMNPTQVEKVVINNGGYDSNCVVKDAEANVRYGIKDSEAQLARDHADIRHNVLFEGQENQKTVLETEARLKDRLSIDRNATDAQFLALNNRLCESEKTTMDVKTEVIRQGYEAKLSAKDAIIDSASRFQHLSERLSDKVAHGFEEVNEKLCECCCEQKVAAVQQTGLLNSILNILSIGGPGNSLK